MYKIIFISFFTFGMVYGTWREFDLEDFIGKMTEELREIEFLMAILKFVPRPNLTSKIHSPLYKFQISIIEKFLYAYIKAKITHQTRSPELLDCLLNQLYLMGNEDFIPCLVQGREQEIDNDEGDANSIKMFAKKYDISSEHYEHEKLIKHRDLIIDCIQTYNTSKAYNECASVGFVENNVVSNNDDLPETDQTENKLLRVSYWEEEDPDNFS